MSTKQLKEVPSEEFGGDNTPKPDKKNPKPVQIEQFEKELSFKKDSSQLIFRFDADFDPDDVDTPVNLKKSESSNGTVNGKVYKKSPFEMTKSSSQQSQEKKSEELQIVKTNSKES